MRQDFILVNNYRIRILEDGIGNNKHIILLHGIGAAAERWAKVMPLLAKRYHVVAPDIIGFGYSDKPNVNYTISFFINFVESFITTLGLRRFSLIGSSFGGQLAAEFVIANKDKGYVDALVLVTPSGLSKEPTEAFTQYIMASLYPSIESAKKAFSLMYCGKQVDDVYTRDFVNRMLLPNAKYAFISTLLNIREHPDLKDRLSMIDVPTLIVWSEKDLLIPVEHAYVFHKSIKGSRLVILNGCGHTPYYEQPERFASIVDEFLNSVSNAKN